MEDSRESRSEPGSIGGERSEATDILNQQARAFGRAPTSGSRRDAKFAYGTLIFFHDGSLNRSCVASDEWLAFICWYGHVRSNQLSCRAINVSTQEPPQRAARMYAKRRGRSVLCILLEIEGAIFEYNAAEGVDRFSLKRFVEAAKGGPIVDSQDEREALRRASESKPVPTLHLPRAESTGSQSAEESGRKRRRT